MHFRIALIAKKTLLIDIYVFTANATWYFRELHFFFKGTYIYIYGLHEPDNELKVNKMMLTKHSMNNKCCFSSTRVLIYEPILLPYLW